MISPRNEQSKLQYLDWQELYETEKPYQLFSAISEEDLLDRKTTNLVFKEGCVETIHDARAESHFALDQEGFAFRTHHTRVKNFDCREEIENVYLPEVEELLKSEIEDVDQVYFFDWRIRKNVEIAEKAVIDANDKMQYLLPARHVHIDQAPSAVIGRVLLHLPEQAEFLLKGRTSAWRPTIDRVEDRPLALCDAGTVEPSDLVEADHVRKHYNGANIYAKPSSKYRWYYLNGQRKEEVTLLKMFDSDASVAQHCLHTSFTHEKVPPAAVPRESIEVRALIFTYPQDSAGH